jgi:tetratricopeptide (TPR) repeat protein
MEFRSVLLDGIIRTCTVMLIATGILCSCARGDGEMTDWDHRDAGWEAYRRQQYDMAAREFLRAARKVRAENEFRKRFPGDDTAQAIFDYRRVALAFKAQGLYEKAIEYQIKWHDVWKQENPFETNPSSEHANFYGEIGDLYRSQGKWEQASDAYQKASELEVESAARLHPEDNPEDYRGAFYQNIGELNIQLGNFESALKFLQENLNWFVARGSMRADYYGAASYRVARAHYYAGDLEMAKAMAKQAAGAPNPLGAYTEHEVNTAMLLAKIAEREGHRKEALVQHYRDMIVYLDPDGDEARTLRAEIYREMGRFQLKNGDLIEAQTAYKEAVRLHRETATATHPNCADAIKGLADVSAAEGNLTSATLYAEEALKILDDSVVPTHPRIAAELVALASIHILAGRSEQAAPLNERIETILQKPLGPWKEDFLDTTAFYADLLEKAGKPDDAEALRQLHARQKDKR